MLVSIMLRGELAVARASANYVAKWSNTWLQSSKWSSAVFKGVFCWAARVLLLSFGPLSWVPDRLKQKHEQDKSEHIASRQSQFRMLKINNTSVQIMMLKLTLSRMDLWRLKKPTCLLWCVYLLWILFFLMDFMIFIYSSGRSLLSFYSRAEVFMSNIWDIIFGLFYYTCAEVH